VEQAHAQDGYNEIHEEQKSALWEFIKYFISPLSILIEIAAILSLVLQDWIVRLLFGYLLYIPLPCRTLH